MYDVYNGKQVNSNKKLCITNNNIFLLNPGERYNSLYSNFKIKDENQIYSENIDYD